MSNDVYVALIAGLSAIAGGAITAIINAITNRKNNLSNALHSAAQALDITTQELVESMINARNLAGELKKKDIQLQTLKSITRKMYQLMESNNIDPDLNEEELELLFETQPLTLIAEKRKRQARHDAYG